MNGYNGEERRRSRTEGKFPAAVLIFLIAQTVAAIWWASSLTTTVSAQGEAIKELKLSVTALTSAKIVVLESEVARLQVELSAAKTEASRHR